MYVEDGLKYHFYVNNTHIVICGGSVISSRRRHRDDYLIC